MTSTLEAIWTSLAVHLWQTTLFLSPILFLERWMRNGPARRLHLLWTVAFVKILLPSSLLQKIVAAAAPRWTERVTAAMADRPVIGILDPTTVFARPTAEATLMSEIWPFALTMLWAGGFVWVLLRMLKHSRIRSSPGQGRGLLPTDREGRLEAALRGTAVSSSSVDLTDHEVLPCVVGFLRPRIVLPISLVAVLPADELRAILLHEDVHRRRRDPLRELMRRLFGAYLFFYPILGSIQRRLRETTELICDDSVLKSGVSAQTYRTALAKAVSFGLRPAQDSLTAGVGEGSFLRLRFDRMTYPRRCLSMSRQRFFLVAAFSLLLVGAILPSVLLTERATGAEAATQEAAVPEETRPLDKMPTIIPETMALPVYPTEEKKLGIEGTVMLQVEVLDDGAPNTIEPIQEVDGHPALTEASLVAVRQWRFEPGEIDGTPVTCQVSIPIQFRLDAESSSDAKD